MIERAGKRCADPWASDHLQLGSRDGRPHYHVSVAGAQGGGARPDLKELLMAPGAMTDDPVPARRARRHRTPQSVG